MIPCRKYDSELPGARSQAAAFMRGPAVCLLLTILTARAGPRSVGEWRSNYYDTGIDNVLVIGATNSSERRRLLEDGLVAALRKDGVTATPSYRLIPSAAGLTRESIEEAIRDQGIDTVMTIRLIGVSEEENFQQTVDRADELSYFTITGGSIEPAETGYYDERTVILLETQVFDTRSQLLVFILRSKLDDTTQSRKAIQAQIDLTMGRLRAHDLIGN
ncbi:MAG: hypothetical protein PVI70_04140 [Gammaproteobacteria bacterium]